MRWGDYEIYDPGVNAPLRTLPRAEARQAYNRLMASKPERLTQLKALLAANGVDFGTDNASLQRINDWFRACVREDPTRPGRLLPDWYSVVNDLGLFIGDAMIERHPALHWVFYTWGKTVPSYQSHAIVGFSSSDPHKDFNIDGNLASYGHRVVLGKDVDSGQFVRWVRPPA